MTRPRFQKLLLPALILGAVMRAPSLFACAMCFGTKSDSPLANGMNWGIMSLLAVIVTVLVGIASFAVFVARRSAVLAAAAAQQQALKIPQKA